jgi:hypothetical protein
VWACCSTLTAARSASSRTAYSMGLAMQRAARRDQLQRQCRCGAPVRACRCYRMRKLPSAIADRCVVPVVLQPPVAPRICLHRPSSAFADQTHLFDLIGSATAIHR